MRNIFFLITIIVVFTIISMYLPKSEAYEYSVPPAFIEHPDTAKIEYPDVTIYYDDGKYIYSYNPKTQTKKQLTSGVGVRLSSKKDKIAYSFYKYNPEFASSSKQQGFYVYDLITGNDKLIYPIVENKPIGIHKWVVDDKYIVLDNTKEDGYIIVDSKSGQIYTTLAINENSSYVFINTDEIIYEDNYPKIRRPHSGSAIGLSIINIKTGKKEILKKASNTDDYCFIKILDNNKFLVVLMKYKKGQTLAKDNPQKSYWIMDKKGNILEEVKNYKPPEYNKDNLSEEIKNLLPEPYNNYQYIWVTLPPINNWVIFFGNNQYQYLELFIIDKTNPHSLRRLFA